MRIVTARRISQIFFLTLMVWFCMVTVTGSRWWHLPGWPVNWLLELDPLVGLATLLATGTLYAGLIWGALTLILTLVLGRFFCGWVCPLGTLQHVMAWVGYRRRAPVERIKANQYHGAQALKYWLLGALLAAAAGETLTRVLTLPRGDDLLSLGLVALVLLILAAAALGGERRSWGRALPGVLAAALLWVAGVRWIAPGISIAGSLQSGLLDPLPLVYRSINLVILPLGERLLGESVLHPRLYAATGSIGIGFALILLTGLILPRGYCRYICPLGALFGTLGRVYLFRVGKRALGCKSCTLCESECQGACAPAGQIRTAECVLCFNCWDSCRHGRMGYGSNPSAAGETPSPDVGRRGVLLSLATGLGLVSLERVQGTLAGNWHPGRVRPPGALAEAAFLQRCIKCGQCMRVCPTNVLHPADLRFGWEAYWTPVLNFGIGLSGCQPNCVACSQICPTAALRPVSLAERAGRGEFSRRGPIRIGTAFVDRGRCLPWAMDRPCIVCQEVCPVSPKAIFTRPVSHPLRDAQPVGVSGRSGPEVRLTGALLVPGALAGGDFRCRRIEDPQGQNWRILNNSATSLTLVPDAQEGLPQPGEVLQMVIVLQQPYVDPALCIGCGICQHECPVRGLPAIRVSAEGETRDPAHRILA